MRHECIFLEDMLVEDELVEETPSCTVRYKVLVNFILVSYFWTACLDVIKLPKHSLHVPK